MKLGKKTIQLDETKRTYVLGGKGNDKILKAQGGAYIDGGDGKDTITAIAGSNTIYGGTGDDSITINSIYSNTIYGGDGSDIIKSGAGHDYIEGGSGRDNTTAGSGDDSIYGGTSDDTINAGDGYNMIYFKRNEGTDNIISGGGNDTLIFLDETFETLKAWKDNQDLIIRGGDDTASVRARLVGYYSGSEHSVKQVQDKNGNTYNVEEISGFQSRSFSMARQVNMEAPILAEKVAWETQKGEYANGADYAPIGKEVDLMPQLTTGYENIQPLSN